MKKWFIRVVLAIFIVILSTCTIGTVTDNVIAYRRAHKMCEAFPVGSQTTLDELIKASVGSDTPPRGVVVSNHSKTETGAEPHLTGWAAHRGWSQNPRGPFDFKTTSFTFISHWLAVPMELWECVITVEKGKVIKNEAGYHDM